MTSPPAAEVPLVRAPGPRWTIARVAAGAATAFAAFTVAALATGDTTTLAATGSFLGAAVAAFALARYRVLQRIGRFALASYVALLTAATIAAGGGSWLAADASRVQLFTANPNVLGAALVTAMAAWAAVAPRRRLVWWAWPIVGLAVLHTGSRTSGAALLVAGTVWLVSAIMQGRPRLAIAPLAVVSVATLAAVAWQYGVVERIPNLLAAPTDLRDGAWNTERAQLLTIVQGGPGPFEGTTSQRVTAQARPARSLVVYQSIGTSEPGVPYVASVFLRADEPQRVVLNSNLARVVCSVGTSWERCVTPVALGNDVSQAQWLLEAADRGGGFDVEVFGAQLERSPAATPFLDARPPWIPQQMVNRFDLRRITLLPTNRTRAWSAGLDIASENRWFGVGPTASPDAFLERTATTREGNAVTYAHNVVVEIAAVYGLVGLLGCVAFVAAVASAVGPGGRRRLLPLLLALAILNTWDVTLFEPVSFVPAVLAAAIVVATHAGRHAPELDLTAG